jgi:hypothetical protein
VIAPHPLLADVFPDLAAEIAAGLRALAEPAEIATSVAGLRVVDRCRCGVRSCATFYTEPRPKGAYGPGHRNLVLDPRRGMLILDIVEDRIVCVEVLDRPELGELLDSALPRARSRRRANVSSR